MIDPKYQSTHMAVSKSAMETMEKMVKQLQSERDVLLSFAKIVLNGVNSGSIRSKPMIDFDLDDKQLVMRSLAEVAIETIAACTDSTKVLE